MISTNRARQLLGDNLEVSQEDLGALLDSLYSLAQIAIQHAIGQRKLATSESDPHAGRDLHQGE